ncbi:unnamed protein product [Rhodiola kirilowii]
MAEISLSDNASTSSLLNSASRTICHVCQKQFSQYTCPRCNSRYCSLHCYKTHSLRCTESFMRENVVKELGQLEPDDQTKLKMLEILKRFHSEEEEIDDMDYDGPTLSEETVEKVLSGSDISFDELTTEEKKQFQRALASGELSKMIEPWDPWWLQPSAKNLSLSKDGTRLIQPLKDEVAGSSAAENNETNPSNAIPHGPEYPLPPIGKISSTKPSPLLAVHLVDITYTYCFVLRLYNGDWQSDTIGSAMAVLSFSSVFGQGAQPESVLEVVSHCLEQTCSPDYRHMGGLQFGLGVLDDVVELLLLGRPGLICALCDLQKLIQAAERDLKSVKNVGVKKTELRAKLKHAERKIYFLMCWVNEQPEQGWPSLASVVKAEKCSLTAYEGAPNSAHRDLKWKAPGKVVIEELQ